MTTSAFATGASTVNGTHGMTPASRDEFVRGVVGRIRGAKALDALFITLKRDLLELFGAEQVTYYAVDLERHELYSTLESRAVKEIRLPIRPTSIAGYVALTGKPVNVADAYDSAALATVSPDLAFDASWDRKTGFHTRQVLAVPVTRDRSSLIGVIEFLNKKPDGSYTPADERRAAEIAAALGATFSSLHQLARRCPGKFDYLTSQDLITQRELDAAVAEARRQGVDVESILLNKYQVRKDDLGVALSLYHDCEFIEFSDTIRIQPELLAGLKREYLRFNFWVPLARRGATIDVLIDNPHDVPKIDSVRRVYQGGDVRFFVGLRDDILKFIDGALGERSPSGSIASILGELAEEGSAGEDDTAADSDIDLNDSVVVRLAHQLIADAYKSGASDIHIEPRGPRKETVVRFRVDGTCVDYERLPPQFRRALVARLKIMARLDIAERRKPQDGKIKFPVGDREVELRVATIPTAGGNEDIVMRILAANKPMALTDLGMSERNLREIEKAATKPYGLILCVGPTGSGKTTTLHAILGFINKPGRKIWTAEDPVEITQEGLRQVQVQPKIGLTFATAMRAFLRADPDVIMVGEMRDHETAATGVEASLTGHLVLSTLHTNSAAETVIRLIDMGVDPFTFGDALLVILAQRLVKRLCSSCREPYHPDITEFIALALAYGEQEFEQLGVQYSDEFVLYRGRGCGACNQTGYKGRAGIHELLVASDELKRLVQTGARVSEILSRARQEGMTTLLQDGIAKSLAGVTDLKQVYAVAIK